MMCRECMHVPCRRISCISHRCCWSWSHFCWDRPGTCHVSCLRFDPLEELGCLSLFECPSQQLQQLSWKAPSSLDLRFHQCVTQLLQENPPSTQCSAVPVLVYFTPYYKGIVGAHINDVEENYKGPTGSHASAAV